MTQNEPASGFSSITSSSTDSARSSVTVKPLPSLPNASPYNTSSSSSSSIASNHNNVLRAYSHSSRRAPPSRLKTDENGHLVRSSTREPEPPVSPTSGAGSRFALSPSSSSNSNASPIEHRISDLANYRRELAILDPAGGRSSNNHNQANNPATGSLSQQLAPWMMGNGGNLTPSSLAAVPTSFYNDSSENVSLASQLSPDPRSAPPRSFQSTIDSPDAAYFNGDDRRPSMASVNTTASSQNSKASGQRGGYRKLQGFFGEEFPGRDTSEVSLVQTNSNSGQERSRSYSHTRPQRERNYSNATDHTRDASPTSSRPRTPVPAPEVVPFLYQEADDIARYGEAPVRDILTGPDRERYVNEGGLQNPPKTSSSSRSGHSIVHLPGHHHRHNKSNEDTRALRPTVSREDTTANYGKDAMGYPNAPGSRSRAESPTPSGNSSYFSAKNGSGQEHPTSPSHHKKGFLGRLRRGHHHKDKDETPTHALKKLPVSTQSLQPKPSLQNIGRENGFPQPEWPGAAEFHEAQAATRPGNGSRQATFKPPFGKRKGTQRGPADDLDEQIGPTDKRDRGTVFQLDTDLNNMDGIIMRPLPHTPINPEFITNFDAERINLKAAVDPDGAWNAPDSWAVKRTEEETAHLLELEDPTNPARPEEKLAPYCIRVFRSDGTFATLQMALDSPVQDVISQILKKTLVTDSLDKYHIVLRKHDLVRVLSTQERPLQIQKRLLSQVGYEDRDRIEEIGREDNSYLCRFLLLSARENDFHAGKTDLRLEQQQKFNHVDLSGRNLVTIPILLYLKAAEIISLNLSRNLSLDLPRDFIQSCTNLRDVKYNNNEARRLPLSLGRASKLTYLDVSNNRLDQLEHAELNALTGLLKLNLANNHLKHLPPYFGQYRALRTINISSNFLEKFPSFLCDLESLVDLDLSFNLIGSFPDNIGKLRNLEKLVITNNRLSGSVPVSFRQLSSLRELDIKFNAISSINTIAELPKLEILAADHNAISQFKGTFERIRSLKLNANPITKFEIDAPVPTLKVLNLSNANLASIDDSFNNLANLERLVLDKNYFVSLPIQIGNLKRLEHFSIANNAVGELPAEIGCLTELKVLNVRNNNIRKLPMDLWWANKLETLNASSNVLNDFPKPASRPPQPPAEVNRSTTTLNGKSSTPGGLSPTPSSEELNDAMRRPSQSSSTLLSVGPSPVPGGPDRKSSLVSVYGKGGRKTSVVSRSTNSSNAGTVTPAPAPRKDSGLSQRMTNTFAGSLRNLYLADNQLDDDVFDQITLLSELRVLNLSYNSISDMPQRSIKAWPQLIELYLSGNDLTTLPADDLSDYSPLQVLHINGNKFTNLPADISRAKKLAVLDCGSNSLKYNISNVPYDWNWNLNPSLRYLNLSGNRRLEIKQTYTGAGAQNREQYTDFSRLTNLRMLGLMDVTLTTQPSIPDQSEDRRVRTSGSLAGHLPYGMADTLGKNVHLSTIDLVVPGFNSSNTETLLGLFDGQALSTGGSKIAKYLHENFGHIFTMELKALKARLQETPEDAMRRAFLALNKDLVTIAYQHTEERLPTAHRGSGQPLVLSKEDLNSGGVATVVYLHNMELYVGNVGDAQAMLIQSDNTHKMLTKKHDPAEPSERARIRDAGGWVSRNGRLNDMMDVSRAFGFADLMPAVQAAPHITHVTIREQDETILIATKELWEYLNPGLVVDIARSERGDLMRASQKLRDLAMAYGATNKIMVMMMSVADLKRRNERSRLNRGQSLSLHLSMPHDDNFPARRVRRAKVEAGTLVSDLERLGAEIVAPTGLIAIVFTDIKNSTNLWETYPQAMRSAIKAHNEVMRRQLRQIGGFEVKTEGDAFMVSFPTATSALLWCFAVQLGLIEVNWPNEILNSVHCQPLYDRENKLIFKGLSVRMGIHWGEPLAEPDPVTRRMDYYGPMVNKASRISAVADGGQIAVSSDFISEIQRCLETYKETPSSNEDSFDDGAFDKAIRNELRSLSSQGFEVKEMGEKKLKGLENPEFVYSLYPQQLDGRIEQHSAHERAQAGGGTEVVEKPATLQPDAGLPFEPDSIWALWRVSLRLEMLCSTLEDAGGRGLQPPETELLERMKQRGGEVTEHFLMKFMEHQVSRIETCVSTLSLRHMVMGDGPIAQLQDLRAPMSAVLDDVAAQFAELERYKALYGPLPPEDHLDGSDTEQEP